MSYTIYFLKHTGLNEENVDAILEATATPQDQHFISPQEQIIIKEQLTQSGLPCTVFENLEKGHIEINYSVFQVMIFNGSIVLDFPFGIEDDEINEQIDLVANTLISNGYIGYDPQTGDFYHNENA